MDCSVESPDRSLIAYLLGSFGACGTGTGGAIGMGLRCEGAMIGMRGACGRGRGMPPAGKMAAFVEPEPIPKE